MRLDNKKWTRERIKLRFMYPKVKSVSLLGENKIKLNLWVHWGGPYLPTNLETFSTLVQWNWHPLRATDTTRVTPSSPSPVGFSKATSNDHPRTRLERQVRVFRDTSKPWSGFTEKATEMKEVFEALDRWSGVKSVCLNGYSWNSELIQDL